MPRVLLTAKTIGTLPAVGVQTEYYDTGANCPMFGLRVSATARVWFLLYKNPHGKQKRLKIGTFPPMSLADAREAARKQLREVQVGAADPASVRDARRTADSFAVLAERYIEQYAKAHKRSWREDARQLRSMVLPKWRTRAAVEITRADVRTLLADVAKVRGGVTANRLRALLSKLFRWSVSQDYLAANPASELPKLTKETSRDRELSDDELRTFWKRLDQAEQEETLPAPVVLWLRLRLLTAQRGGSINKMRWADLDFERRVWDVPAAAMKGGKAHVVPLSPSVVKLLKAERATARKGATFVLEGGRGRRQRLGVIEALGFEDFQPRDLRRTATTGMTRAGISRFIVARVLGHVDPSVTGVYDRHEYLNEKRVALDTWDRVLSGILTGKKAAVVPFSRR